MDAPGPRAHYFTEFLCTVCFEEWEMDWLLGDNVTCPTCGTPYEAVWETNAAGQLIGPWLGKALGGPTREYKKPG